MITCHRWSNYIGDIDDGLVRYSDNVVPTRVTASMSVAIATGVAGAAAALDHVYGLRLQQ